MAAGETLATIPLAAEVPAAPGMTIIERLLALARQSGPIVQLPGAGRRTLLLSTFALVDEICDDNRFDKAVGGGLGEMRGLLGDGLFTADTANPNWHKAHNILMPPFSMPAMRGYMPQMLDLADQLLLKWQRLNTGEEIDVPDDMTRLTLDTIGLCGFGYRFNSFYRTDQHPFVNAMVSALARGQRRAYGIPAQDPAADEAQEQRDAEIMNTLVDTVIQERRAGGPEALAAHNDLLSYMLNGVDKQTGERLDVTNIRYQILTFMIAGHETTSGALSFALAFLLGHPEVVARASDEVDRVLGGDLDTQPTYEQVRQLTYVSQILKEGLRLWPTAPAFSRHPYQARTLGGKYAITPEDRLMAFIPQLHRDPAVWGQDAEAFNPDHFSPEAEQARPANAYLPFGVGQRACIGRQFALQEATLVLGMILQRFELIDSTHYQLQIKQTLTIKPDHFKLTVRPRPRSTVVVPAPQSNGHRRAEMAAAAPAAATVPSTTPSATQHNTPLLVLFGSNLGTAENLAHRIADDGATRGFAATVAPLDSYVDKLPTAGAVIVVTASYNGTPPDNAVNFCDWLRDGSIAPAHLQGVRYSVFGCGDRDWAATFQAIPRLIDTQLAAYGAQRIYPRGEGDARGDFDGQFQTWYAGLWAAISTALALDLAATPAAVQGPLYRLEYVAAPETNPYASASGAKPLMVLVNRELTARNGWHAGLHPGLGERSTRHIEVALQEGMDYRTGDHLAVIPHNSMELIERLLVRFGVARDAFIRIHRNGPGTTQLPLEQPLPVLGLLARYVELQDVATRGQIKQMADYDECPPEREQLLSLAEDPRYTEEVLAKRLTLVDLLEAYPACTLPPNMCLEWLRPLRPRYYSIASSPLADARTCAITVAVVDAPARSGQGTFKGTCSSYLQQQPPRNAIYAFVRSPQMTFRPPDDPGIPIIMVGPGTGFAPFRGFLQERAALKARGARLGKALLFFGCRSPEEFIYQDELQMWADQGITEVYTAFSRVAGQPKTYVQDQIKAHADDVWQMLQDGAVIYVCGDASRMEPDVRKAFAAIYQAKKGVNEQQAAAWLDQMARANHYLADVWAGG
jgi:cytochrome P450/NADPH-cytochrome P450 reductase